MHRATYRLTRVRMEAGRKRRRGRGQDRIEDGAFALQRIAEAEQGSRQGNPAGSAALRP
jgi:hypothetical protein